MRAFLLVSLMSCATAVVAADALKPVALKDVRLTGWIGAKNDRLIRERVTSDWAQNVMMKECEQAFVDKDDDSTTVGMWKGEFWGKTMLGFARVAEYTQDPKLLKFIGESCHRLMALQEPDGYLGTYRKKDFLKVTDWEAVIKERGGKCDWNWNLWCRTFTIWGLYEAGRVTGDKSIVEGAAKSLEQIIDMLHEKKIDIVDTGCNAGLPSCTIIRPALLLHKATGKAKFLDFAKEIVSKWDRDGDVPPNFFRNADSGVSPYRWYEKKFDHARNYEWPKVNEMTNCLEGLVEYWQATNDARSFDVAKKMFDILWRDERNAVGSVGYNDRFHEAASIPSAITEPCDILVWMMLCQDLYLATGEARYADVLEASFLNAFLASVTRDGKWGMRGVRSHGRNTAAGRQSGMTHSHCCVNNLPRGFMDVAEAMLAKDADGAYRLAFYTDASAQMDDVSVEISGNWPVGDVAHVKVTTPNPVTVKFRIPGWTKTATVNGAAAEAKDGWCAVEAKRGENWLDLAFDMEAKIVPPEKPCDVANVLNNEILRNRWHLNGKDGDLIPYFLMRDLPRLRRGPLFLAKCLAVGDTEQEVFCWGRLDSQKEVSPYSWKCALTPLWNPNVWGAWYAKFTPQDSEIWWQEFEVKVSDYASAGDKVEEAPVKSFSIFY